MDVQISPKGAEKPNSGANTGEQMIIDEILEFKKHFDTRMDGLHEYLKTLTEWLKKKLG